MDIDYLRHEIQSFQHVSLTIIVLEILIVETTNRSSKFPENQPTDRQPLRVGLDITQTVKRRGRGIARYIREIMPRLSDLASQVEPTCCIRSVRWFKRRLVVDLVPDVRRSWLAAPVWMTTRNLDIFHSFGNHLPAFCSIPRTFTIHDFRALDRPPKPGIGGDRLRRNITRSDGILCLTEHGKERLLFHYPNYDPARIAVVPHGVDRTRFFPQDKKIINQTAARYGLTSPFVVQVGSWFPHKNLDLSIRAFARSQTRANGYHLVFIGGGAPLEYRKSLDILAASENVQDVLHWISDVPANALPALLSGAACLLHPSLYEGFALPLLEAMAVGLPGVVSDSSCLPEVSGGLWPVAGQQDPDGFAAGIDAMVLDEGKRIEAIQAGLIRAAKFTWENTAAETAAFLQQIQRLGKRTSGDTTVLFPILLKPF